MALEYVFLPNTSLSLCQHYSTYIANYVNLNTGSNRETSGRGLGTLKQRKAVSGIGKQWIEYHYLTVFRVFKMRKEVLQEVSALYRSAAFTVFVLSYSQVTTLHVGPNISDVLWF